MCNVSVCLCMHARAYVCVHAMCQCVCVRTCVYVCARVRVCVCVCVCVCVRANTCVCVCLCVCMQISLCVSLSHALLRQHCHSACLHGQVVGSRSLQYIAKLLAFCHFCVQRGTVDLQACWEEEPDKRPDFESIIADLRGMLRCTAATKQRSQALTGNAYLAPNVFSLHCLWFTWCSITLAMETHHMQHEHNKQWAGSNSHAMRAWIGSTI